MDWTLSANPAITALRLPTALTLNNMEAMLSAAVDGHGIAYVPDFLAREALAQGQLDTVLEGHCEDEGQFWALWPSSRHLSPKIRVFVDFAAARPLSTGVVRDWLASERGMAATPHAQRSRAQVKVELKPAFDEMPLIALVDALESALATPVQTAVKREDEQAFARLNAENLMFCEDAARRVASVLDSDPRVERYDATVSHFESLHPHDAVARVSGVNA